jgi:hypothetical protein
LSRCARCGRSHEAWALAESARGAVCIACRLVSLARKVREVARRCPEIPRGAVLDLLLPQSRGKGCEEAVLQQVSAMSVEEMVQRVRCALERGERLFVPGQVEGQRRAWETAPYRDFVCECCGMPFQVRTRKAVVRYCRSACQQRTAYQRKKEARRARERGMEPAADVLPGDADAALGEDEGRHLPAGAGRVEHE